MAIITTKRKITPIESFPVLTMAQTVGAGRNTKTELPC